MNVEELKTAIGHLQLDLRGNWGWEYTVRLDELIHLLNQLLVISDMKLKCMKVNLFN